MEKNKETPDKKLISRGSFIKNAALATAGFYIVPRHVLGGKGFTAPSDKLIIASVGIGGKGESDISNIYSSGKAEFSVFCDVDDRRAVNSRKKFPSAKYYKDY